MFNWDDDDNKARKPLIFYMVIAVTVILLLNAFVVPMMMAGQVQVVGYSDFLEWVDSGKVSEVSLSQNSDQIIFVAKNDQGQEELFKTAVFPDDVQEGDAVQHQRRGHSRAQDLSHARLCVLCQP